MPPAMCYGTVAVIETGRRSDSAYMCDTALRAARGPQRRLDQSAAVVRVRRDRNECIIAYVTIECLLMRAASILGQLGDPHYLKRAHALQAIHWRPRVVTLRYRIAIWRCPERLSK
jgi:hypothetical protein